MAELLFPPSISRGLPSVIQSAAPVMPRQWSFRSLLHPRHHLSKCAERDHGHHAVSLTITDSTSVPNLISALSSVSSTYTTSPNPTSNFKNSKLFSSPTHLPAAATTPKSTIISNQFPTLHSNASPAAAVPLPGANAQPSNSSASPCAVPSPALQIHLLWLLVPPSFLSSPELLLGAGSESPALCAPPSCPL